MRDSKFLIALLITALLAGAAGLATERWWLDGSTGSGASEQREPLYWVAPMDPEYRRDGPGQSPMGMDLVPVYAEDQDGADADGVRISPAVRNNLGVRTATAESGPLPRIVETVGYVGFDEDRVQHVHTRVEGWIEGLSASAVGDPVSAGQTLFRLYAPRLVSAQEEYLNARRSGAGQLIAASEARLRTLGMDAGQVRRLAERGEPSPHMEITARQDGVIATLGIRDGQYVTPGTHTIEIADLSSVWVVAEVFQRQAAWIERGLPVELSFDSYPGESWSAEVDYVYPTLDATTRTLQVRIRLPNEDGRLRPDMFGRVRIQGDPVSDSVHVPREAVIRGAGKDRVVLDTGDGRFQTVPVDLGIESGQRIEIVDGLSAGDRVVVSAQFLIDSESSLRGEEHRGEEAMSGHDHHPIQGDGT